MWLAFIVIILLCAVTVSGLFPGATPDEGDIRHLYPLTTLAIALDDHSYALPYLLGWLENVEYPKKRMNLVIYLLPHSKEDMTKEQIQWWQRSVFSLFRTMRVADLAEVKGNWMEDALVSARQQKSSCILLWDGADLPHDPHLIQKTCRREAVLSSIVVPSPFPGGLGNVQLDDAEINMASPFLPLVLNLSHSDSSYLTFDGGNLRGFDQQDATPISVLVESARRMDIKHSIDRESSLAWHFHHTLSWEERRRLMEYLLADIIADRGLHLLPLSRTVRHSSREPSKHGFDKIFVINLERRTERREKMEVLCGVLALECELFTATDGKNLPTDSAHAIKRLPSFRDPHHNRIMTNGEVGCFLSHYRIWEEMVANGWKNVVVLEDDARFAEGGMERLDEMMEDINKHEFQWDLIYIGRKRLQNQAYREFWVPEIRHLSTVGYSYWTISYVISLEGAKKLLAPSPLNRIIPVDEYIPLMADLHPNDEYSEEFEDRTLQAYTMFPVAVFPQRYTLEAGHVSDTETSGLFQDIENEVVRDEL